MSRDFQMCREEAHETVDAELSRLRLENHTLRELVKAQERHTERIKQGLTKALDGWLRVTNRGIPAALEQESVAEIAELRRLVQP